MGNTNELSSQVNRSNARINNDLQNSLAQTARGVDRTNRAVDKSVAKTNKDIKIAFQPLEDSANKTFSKKNMENLDDTLVSGFKDSSRVLGEITKIGDKVLNNPFTNVLGAVPILGEVITGARLANTGLKAVGVAQGGLGDIIDRKQYDGKTGTQQATNALEKTIKTTEDVIGTGITFA
jgi:hypothetical protein